MPLVQATALGDRALVVWRSARRGIRFRIAKPNELAGSPDHVLYDDRLVNAAPSTMSTVSGMRLIARPDAAIVILDSVTTTAVRTNVFRIAPDGAVALLQ